MHITKKKTNRKVFNDIQTSKTIPMVQCIIKISKEKARDGRIVKPPKPQSLVSIHVYVDYLRIETSTCVPKRRKGKRRYVDYKS